MKFPIIGEGISFIVIFCKNCMWSEVTFFGKNNKDYGDKIFNSFTNGNSSNIKKCNCPEYIFSS